LAAAQERKSRFPPFEKSAVERLAEATRSPFDGLDPAMRTIRDALGGSQSLLERAEREARGTSRISKQIEEAQKSIQDALGGTLGDYYKSRDHMRDVFGTGTLADEAAKMINGPSAGTEADKYLAGLEGRLNREAAVPELPALHIPPNPIHETNEHLAELGEKVDALVDLQAKQAEVFDKLLQAQVTALETQAASAAAQERASKRNQQVAWITIGVAVIAIVVGAVFGGI
jgi:hypothetical protein